MSPKNNSNNNKNNTRNTNSNKRNGSKQNGPEKRHKPNDDLKELDDFCFNILKDLLQVNTPPSSKNIEPVYVCPGKFCDHEPQSTNVKQIPDRFVNKTDSYKITLDDLIDLGACFHCKQQTKFKNISLERLAKLYDPLSKLRDIIGMQLIKKNFANKLYIF